MRTRRDLAPQMIEYDKLGRGVWLPYLMYFNTPNYSSRFVNTGSRGFRVTYKDSRPISDFQESHKYPTCVFMGGSTAFGVGATSDRNTIPSVLSSNTDYFWFNFGGRAYNSTQELLLFLFHYQRLKNIKKVVIFSGFNNLALFWLSQNYSKELGSFFGWSQYNSLMNIEPLPLKGRALGRFLCKLQPSKASIPDEFKKIENHNDQKDELLNVLWRDISIWKLLVESLKAKLYYVLQPVPNWIKKGLTEEEQKLFKELDGQPGNMWKTINENINPELHLWYREQLVKMCGYFDISFLDMNDSLASRPIDDKWLYVDRVHLTDQGYRLAADILRKEM